MAGALFTIAAAIGIFVSMIAWALGEDSK